jgi:predicted ribosomally synthesized peptide with nif11-like leader
MEEGQFMATEKISSRIEDLVRAVVENPMLHKKLKAEKSVESRIALLKEHGIDCEHHEAKAALDSINEAMLEKIVGGTGGCGGEYSDDVKVCKKDSECKCM